MTFDYEHQMVEPAEQWLASQGLATKREFSMPWGICDLVGCSLNKKKVRKRLELGQTKPIGPQMRLIILSRIPDQEEGKSVTMYRLYRDFADFFDEARIALEIERLITNKFVQVTPEGAFQKLNGWVPLHKKVVALELKLTRINDALHQAMNHLEFADDSYVGVPIEIGQRLINNRKKAEFIHEGIGIVGIGRKKCKVFLKPTPNKSPRNEIVQMHCVERFWRTRFKDIGA
jgi:hypothetical protein